MYKYIAVVEKEPDTDYGVFFPDIPGCVTAGSDLNEALEFAHEALELHLQSMIDDGDDIPATTSLDDIKSNHPDAVTYFLVSVNADSKVVRANLTIKETDLRRIDRFADDHGFTRSGFMVQAALQRIHTHKERDAKRQ